MSVASMQYKRNEKLFQKGALAIGRVSYIAFICSKACSKKYVASENGCSHYSMNFETDVKSDFCVK